MTPTSIALNRFGLGARPDDRIGDPRAWLTGQLGGYVARPAALAPTATTAEAAGVIARFQDDRTRQRRAARQRGSASGDTMESSGTARAMPGKAGRSPLRQEYGRDVNGFLKAAIQARINAALVTDTPFTERLVYFWSNHFAVSSRNAVGRALAGSYEVDAIRPHVLGNFRDLLRSAEQHPAMLFYLNQTRSVGPDSPAGRRGGRGKKSLGLNENLAREIMELHTVGVRSGYTQDDVIEFARALTGWTTPDLAPSSIAGAPGSFGFDPERHQPGPRTLLGKVYADGGVKQGEAMLDDLARHPATARHIATKLTRHFAGSPEPVAMVNRLAAAFTRSDGDLSAVYRALIESPEAWAERPLRFRMPWEWAIATLRASGMRQMEARESSELMSQLGQPTWRPPQPSGWDDDDATWASPDGLMRRVEAAERLASAKTDPVDARKLAAVLYPGAVSPATMQAIERAETPAQGLALLFLSPEMMRR